MRAKLISGLIILGIVFWVYPEVMVRLSIYQDFNSVKHNALKGDANAQNELAFIYEIGLGHVRENQEKAGEWGFVTLIELVAISFRLAS